MTLRNATPYRWGLLLVLAAAAGQAHDVPDFVPISVFMAPTSDQLEVLVRVPFPALIDIDFPALPGSVYLDLPKVEPLLPGVAGLWISDLMDVYEDQARLPKPRIVATRVSEENDREFTTVDQARAHVLGSKLSPDARVAWTAAALDVLLSYPIHSPGADFSMQARFGRLGVKAVTNLQFRAASGEVRSFMYEGDPGMVNLNPSWLQAGRSFFKLGASRMWHGKGQWIFLLCLCVLFRGDPVLYRALFAFTVAYSLAVCASAAGWIPQGAWMSPLIQVVIAISILYTALQNIGMRMTVRVAGLTTFGFGMVHGLALGSGLPEQLQFGGAHPFVSVLAFNAGIELVQLAGLALLWPVLALLFRMVRRDRNRILLMAAVLAHSAWHNLVNSAGEFGELLPWMRFQPDLAALEMAGVLAAVIFLATAGRRIYARTSGGV